MIGTVVLVSIMLMHIGLEFDVHRWRGPDRVWRFVHADVMLCCEHIRFFRFLIVSVVSL